MFEMLTVDPNFPGHGICNNLSKSTTLPVATDDARMLGKEAVELLKAMKANAADLRGVRLSRALCAWACVCVRACVRDDLTVHMCVCLCVCVQCVCV